MGGKGVEPSPGAAADGLSPQKAGCEAKAGDVFLGPRRGGRVGGEEVAEPGRGWGAQMGVGAGSLA